MREIEEIFAGQDPYGTPAALLDEQPLDVETLYEPDALDALIRS